MILSRRAVDEKLQSLEGLPGRRGMTVLVVMLLMSITLAMSYSIMRSQMTGIQLQANNDRSYSARQAALAGLNAGMRSMRVAGWSGTGSTLGGTLSSTDSYAVTFTAGDASLTSGSASYNEYPLRVTLLSTGTSVDPAHPAIASTYQVQAVMRLIPRKLSPVPTNWSTLTSYTIYQMTNANTTLSLPCHIDGPVRLQDTIDVASMYTWTAFPQQRYFSDLAAMIPGGNEAQTLTRSGVTGGSFTLTFQGATTGSIAYNASASIVQTALQNLSTIGAGNVTVSSGGSGVWVVTFGGQLAAQNVPAMSVDTSNLSGTTASLNSVTTIPGAPGLPDLRPFSGPIFAPNSRTNSKNMGLLTTNLGLTFNNIPQTTTATPPVSFLATYRLYPGGPLYNCGLLPGSLANVTLAPDPIANPLGIFYSSGNVMLGNNVTITGTVATGGDLNVVGTNVKISPFHLPPLDGTTTPIRLPSVITLGDFHVADGASATVIGLTYAANRFLVDPGTETTGLTLTGNLIVGADLTIGDRNEWSTYSTSQWDTFYNNFLAQLGSASSNSFFPQWLASEHGRSHVPLLTMQQDSTPVVQQWQNLSNPVYVVASGDSGLHWDFVSWSDRP